MMTAKRARALARKSRRRAYRQVKEKVLTLVKTEVEDYGNTDVSVIFSVTGVCRREKFYHWLVGKKLERQGFKVEFEHDCIMRIYW